MSPRHTCRVPGCNVREAPVPALSEPRVGGVTMLKLSVPPFGSLPASVIASGVSAGVVSPACAVAMGIPGSPAKRNGGRIRDIIAAGFDGAEREGHSLRGAGKVRDDGVERSGGGGSGGERRLPILDFVGERAGDIRGVHVSRRA